MVCARRSIVSIGFLFLAAASIVAQDKPAAPPYPSADTYEAYVQYVHGVLGTRSTTALFDWEPFECLMQAKRYEGVYQLAKALHDTAPETKYCLGGWRFINPINLAYEAGQFDLVKRLLALDRELVRMSDCDAETFYLEPVATAVVHNDTLWVQAFLDAGADINTDRVKSSRNGTYPANLFTVSPSKGMDAFLLSKHVATVYTLENPQDGSCNDDNVRLRSDPGLQGTVLGKLMKGDSFKVLATTYKRDSIDGVEACWVKISFKSQVGWIFQSFVACDYFDLP